MNCPKCNAPLGANDAFCLSCGTKVTQQAQYAAPSAYTDPASYAAGAPAAAAAPAKKVNFSLDSILKDKDGKLNTKLIMIAGAALAVLLVIIIIVSAGGSAKSVAKKYLKAEYEGDIATMIENEFIDDKELKNLIKDAAKEEGLSEKEVYEDIAAEINDSDDEANADFNNFKGFLKYTSERSEEETKEYLEETYGSDYKIKVEIEDVETCTKSQSEEYRDDLDDGIGYIEDLTDSEFSFDSDDAKKFVEVEYIVTIEGSDDVEEFEGTLVLVKIKGDWKVYESSMGELGGFDIY